MINLLSAFRRDDHPVRLNREFHLDLLWWLEFFQSWNGYSFLLSPRWAPIPNLHVSSDAAGSVGYGAILGRDWFMGRWSPLQLPLSIAYKELFPIVPVGSSVVMSGASSPLSVGGQKLLCVYCSSRSWEIKCHS